MKPRAVMSELGHTHNKSLAQSWPSAAELFGFFSVCFVSSLKRCVIFKGCLEKLYVALCLKSHLRMVTNLQRCGGTASTEGQRVSKPNKVWASEMRGGGDRRQHL